MRLLMLLFAFLASSLATAAGVATDACGLRLWLMNNSLVDREVYGRLQAVRPLMGEEDLRGSLNMSLFIHADFLDPKQNSGGEAAVLTKLDEYLSHLRTTPKRIPYRVGFFDQPLHQLRAALAKTGASSLVGQKLQEAIAELEAQTYFAVVQECGRLQYGSEYEQMQSRLAVPTMLDRPEFTVVAARSLFRFIDALPDTQQGAIAFLADDLGKLQATVREAGRTAATPADAARLAESLRWLTRMEMGFQQLFLRDRLRSVSAADFLHRLTPKGQQLARRLVAMFAREPQDGSAAHLPYLTVEESAKLATIFNFTGIVMAKATHTLDLTADGPSEGTTVSETPTYILDPFSAHLNEVDEILGEATTLVARRYVTLNYLLMQLMDSHGVDSVVRREGAGALALVAQALGHAGPDLLSDIEEEARALARLAKRPIAELAQEAQLLVVDDEADSLRRLLTDLQSARPDFQLSQLARNGVTLPEVARRAGSGRVIAMLDAFGK